MDQLPEHIHLDMLNRTFEAIVLIDQYKKVIYYNQAFKNIYGDSDYNKKVFGESINCQAAELCSYSNKPADICTVCKLDQSIKRTLAQKKDQEKESMVLQRNIDGEVGFQLIQYQTYYLYHNQSDYVMLSIIDHTDLGDEVMRLNSE